MEPARDVHDEEDTQITGFSRSSQTSLQIVFIPFPSSNVDLIDIICSGLLCTSFLI